VIPNPIIPTHAEIIVSQGFVECMKEAIKGPYGDMRRPKVPATAPAIERWLRDQGWTDGLEFRIRASRRLLFVRWLVRTGRMAG
jgi:hypothetical protein